MKEQAPGIDPPVNPYTRWIHDHPEVLLADPTPELLREKWGGALRPEGVLVCDLGCGSGNFLLQIAARRPIDRFIGFELRYKRLVKAARKVERAGLKNVLLLREQAERIHRYFPRETLGEVHLNFPDPWPKRSQWKNRLVSPLFLTRLAGLLRPGGTFHLKTDHSGYFLHSLSLLSQVPELGIRAFSNDLLRCPRPGESIRTEFEHLFHSKQRPIHYLEMEKTPATG